MDVAGRTRASSKQQRLTQRMAGSRAQFAKWMYQEHCLGLTRAIDHHRKLDRYNYAPIWRPHVLNCGLSRAQLRWPTRG